MSGKGIWVALVLLLALLSVGAVFYALMDSKSDGGSSPENSEALEEQVERLRAQMESMRTQMDRKEAEQATRFATMQAQMQQAEAEAQRMAEEINSDQEARLEALNLEVFREATARAQAEEEMNQLEARLGAARDELAEARQRQETLREKLENEDGGGTAAVAVEVEESLMALQRREDEIERLRLQNEALAAERQRALQRQIELEQMILAEGGAVTLVKPLVYSPNHKPRTR